MWVGLTGVARGVEWGWRAWHGVWVRLEGVAQGVGWT